MNRIGKFYNSINRINKKIITEEYNIYRLYIMLHTYKGVKCTQRTKGGHRIKSRQRVIRTYRNFGTHRDFGTHCNFGTHREFGTQC